ncbi:prolyl oligopeptidase family serine peptidase [Gordonia liuliyuniae]|uniref:Prolyl oligopeptidase family serine peptidase n=1 Tax=Gordonia liuliyuniae TaxID=2911517 RepID=A0ABS9ISQ5_9ACTN|nr:prolyl oligopeptidase family serine peptidase [Gordonia liuliyuniae]MCF8588592.1 prolyl oligopeptidase family serine peptidase [Gordonia liuliyuniae]
MTDANTTANDPYLWLEEVDGDDALAWVRAHNTPTVDELTGSERFAQMQADTLEILDTDDRIPYVRRRGDYLYNFWRDATHPYGLWRRTTLDEYRTDVPEWDVLIDVDALREEEGENWVWAGASMLRPDYDRALVSLSRGGADATVVREYDVPSRTWVDGGFGLPENKSNVSWIDRDTVYVGTEFGEQPDGEGSWTSSGYPRVVKRWTRGTDLSQAETVFTGSVDDVAVGAAFDPTPGYRRHFVYRATDFYNTDDFEVIDGELVAIDIPSDASYAVHLDYLMVSPKSSWTVDGAECAPGSLLVFDYPAFVSGDRTHRVLFAPDAHTSLQDYAFTRSRLVLTTLHDVATRIQAFEIGTWAPAELPGIPDLATVGVLDVDPDHSDEIWLSSSSFTQAPSLLYGDATIGVAPIKSSPEHFDAADVQAQQVFATSDDGTQVPYFVVKRDDVESGPTLLYGYGGFENSLTPGYLAVTGRNWIARGGIFVYANIRGGGEYGPTWHTQAQKAGRHLVYEDFAAIARDLVARGWTTPQTLAARGGSNGGLLMGVMTTKYPELFGALVCQVPLIDMRRYHLLLAGASWMAEYGDPDDPAEWEFLSKHSPYQLIRADVDYPELLVTTSTRDDRVHPGHARKFTARLEETGHRVRYYENIEGGHGGAADNKQSAFKEALAYEFLWRTIGATAGH